MVQRLFHILTPAIFLISATDQLAETLAETKEEYTKEKELLYKLENKSGPTRTADLRASFNWVHTGICVGNLRQ